MWSNEKIFKLIEDYHASYCLWDATSPDYKNWVKRKVTLESLAAKLNVTVAEIEKKIHNLKTPFNRERKKILQLVGPLPKSPHDLLTLFAIPATSEQVEGQPEHRLG